VFKSILIEASYIPSLEVFNAIKFGLSYFGETERPLLNYVLM
jgi:hypothetical protein